MKIYVSESLKEIRTNYVYESDPSACNCKGVCKVLITFSLDRRTAVRTLRVDQRFRFYPGDIVYSRELAQCIRVGLPNGFTLTRGRKFQKH